MRRLVGVPIGTLTVALVFIVAAAISVVGALAVRNRVFLRIGIRNLTRRRARTATIVVGLMLGTAIIASALGTGDTVGLTIRSSVLTSLGNTDEAVSVKTASAELPQVTGQASDTGYFPESIYRDVAKAVKGSALVDGVAPAIIEPVAVQNQSSRQNEPRVTLFASDADKLAGFGAITRRSTGQQVSLADLGPTDAYINAKAAKELHATVGDHLVVFAAGRPTSGNVGDVVR